MPQTNHQNRADTAGPHAPAVESYTPTSSEFPYRYDAKLADHVERTWQDRWDDWRGPNQSLFHVPNPGETGFDASRPKYYVLDMFPYPSGAGLHVGHPEGYTATDILSRFKRMCGFNVLHPMGWDAFGLPAEQYAIQTGIHPAETTRKSIDTFRRQLKRFGFCYDWAREFGTIDETYYHWTQWIFLRIYHAWFDAAQNRARHVDELVSEAAAGRVATPKPWAEMSKPERDAFIDDHRLAYLKEQVVNWCPKLGTVLANDEVIDGKSERGGYPVLRKPLKQWVFRITAYADRLLKQLDALEWPESTKTMQRDWIGRSEGAEIEFALALGTPTLRVGSDRNSSTPAASEGSQGAEHEKDPATPDTASAVKYACGSVELDDIDANPAITSRPKGFLGRDPYPPGIYGPARDLIRSKRFLPHLQLPGATYFVTWRCLPGESLTEAERNLTLRALTHFDGQRCRVYAACVMHDHVHWIVRPFEGVDLIALRESVKRFAANQINAARSRTGRFWDAEAFDHIVRDGEYFSEFVAYVIRNPVEEGLAVRPGEYRWTFVHRDVFGHSSPQAPHSESGATHLRVFTTRPDTIFGATYMVVAPEHELCSAIVRRELAVPEPTRAALEKYVAWARNKSDVERQENKEKTGVFTGVHAINPATGHEIPVWAADYVLTGYGTGAIMAVPAHDERDFEFAEQFALPIKDVVYTRQELAMRYFADHATPAEQAADRWPDLLSDFLGLVTTASTPPERFLEAITTVRVRRHVPGQGEPQRAGPPDAPGALGKRRGVTKSIWLDFLESMHLPSFAALKQLFDDAGFAKHQGAAVDEPGFAVNSANTDVSLDGLHTHPAIEAIIAWLEKTGQGARRINYKLRDWVFSRQRYWGEPFPIVYDREGRAYPVMESALPVKLPVLADYAPVESDDPQPLLAKVKDWVNTTAGAAGVDPSLLPPSTPVIRETNTMPGSAGSSWYAIRYCDPKNNARLVSREAEKYWMGPSSAGAAPTKGTATGVAIGGVDFYLGGSEHAVGHLLYSRFWQNVLYDLGEVSTAEPFRRLYHQGLITSFAYQRKDKTLVASDLVKEVGEKEYVEASTGQPVAQIIAKMSKSLKNVVNPDDVIAEFGADTFRLYEMYMGPLDQSKPWNPRDIAGCFRFLQRVWRNLVDEQTGASRVLPAGSTLSPEAAEALRATHRTIKGVRKDIEELGFNTAISKLIELNNLVSKLPAVPLEIAKPMILMLSPLAPHIAEELWARVVGSDGTSAADRPFPEADESLLAADTVEIAVQIAGKVRARIRVPVGAPADAVEAAAMADAAVQAQLVGKQVTKVIVVPGRMVNIVAK